MYTRNGVQKKCSCQTQVPVNIDTNSQSHIDGFDIYIVRGDSLDVAVPLYRNGQQYTLGQDEILHSQCRLKGDCSFIVWDKMISAQDQVLHILPTDTEGLDPQYNYVWDLQIESPSRVETVVPASSNVIIIADATRRLQE